MIEIFSWFLVIYGLIGLWVTGRYNWGWLLAVSFQVGWVVYAVYIEATALAVQSVAFGAVALRNYRIGR